MQPIASYFADCDMTLSHLFHTYLEALKHDYHMAYYASVHCYSYRTSILDMQFEGFHSLRLLLKNGIKKAHTVIPWDDTSSPIYDGYKELIQVWSSVSKYNKLLTFHTLSEYFLTVTENQEAVEKVVGVDTTQWLMNTELEFNAYKGKQLIGRA